MGTRVLYFNVQLAGTLTLALCLSSRQVELSVGLFAALVLNAGTAFLLHRAYRRGPTHARMMGRLWQVAVVVTSLMVLALTVASVATTAGLGAAP
jgi:hypothetical protein